MDNSTSVANRDKFIASEIMENFTNCNSIFVIYCDSHAMVQALELDDKI